MEDEFVMDLISDGTPVPIEIASEIMGLTEDQVRDVCDIEIVKSNDGNRP